MSAKVELEAYVNSEHPHPEYLRHHISSYFDTLAKQPALEGHHLVADGFSDETSAKEAHSTAAKICNGHVNSDAKPGTCFANILDIIFNLIIKYYY